MNCPSVSEKFSSPKEDMVFLIIGALTVRPKFFFMDSHYLEAAQGKLTANPVEYLRNGHSKYASNLSPFRFFTQQGMIDPLSLRARNTVVLLYCASTNSLHCWKLLDEPSFITHHPSSVCVLPLPAAAIPTAFVRPSSPPSPPHGLFTARLACRLNSSVSLKSSVSAVL